MGVSRARTADRGSAVALQGPGAPPATGDRGLRIAVVVLSVIGLGIAAYLTYVHYAGLKVACTNTGCETVQSSVYAKVSGVPVPVLGLVGYVAILGSAVLLRGDLSRVAGFGLALIGFLFSAYLTYRELFTIHAICEWCVSSAVVMTVLLVLTGIRVVRGEPLAR
jgi:uncharacterized membrane protein